MLPCVPKHCTYCFRPIAWKYYFLGSQFPGPLSYCKMVLASPSVKLACTKAERGLWKSEEFSSVHANFTNNSLTHMPLLHSAWTGTSSWDYKFVGDNTPKPLVLEVDCSKLRNHHMQHQLHTDWVIQLNMQLIMSPVLLNMGQFASKSCVVCAMPAILGKRIWVNVSSSTTLCLLCIPYPAMHTTTTHYGFSRMPFWSRTCTLVSRPAKVVSCRNWNTGGHSSGTGDNCGFKRKCVKLPLYHTDMLQLQFFPNRNTLSIQNVGSAENPQFPRQKAVIVLLAK